MAAAAAVTKHRAFEPPVIRSIATESTGDIFKKLGDYSEHVAKNEMPMTVETFNDVMPSLNDELFVTLVQHEEGKASSFFFAYNFTKNKFIPRSFFEFGSLGRLWEGYGLITRKKDAEAMIKKDVNADLCKCTRRDGGPRDEAVSADYVNNGVARANIICINQQLVRPESAGGAGAGASSFGGAGAGAGLRYSASSFDFGKGKTPHPTQDEFKSYYKDIALNTLGFTFCSVLSHGTDNHGIFIDIICGKPGVLSNPPRRDAKGNPARAGGTTNLLNYIIGFARDSYGAKFANLHSIAHVVPFYSKQDFEFRTDCTSEPEYSTKDIIAAYTGAGVKFPGCPIEVLIGSTDGASYETILHAFQALDEKGYVLGSKSTNNCTAISKILPELFQLSKHPESISSAVMASVIRTVDSLVPDKVITDILETAKGIRVEKEGQIKFYPLNDPKYIFAPFLAETYEKKKETVGKKNPKEHTYTILADVKPKSGDDMISMKIHKLLVDYASTCMGDGIHMTKCLPPKSSNAGISAAAVAAAAATTKTGAGGNAAAAAPAKEKAGAGGNAAAGAAGSTRRGRRNMRRNRHTTRRR
jgi:hypothetical protein